MFDDRMAKLGYDEAGVKLQSWSDDDGTNTIDRWIGSKRLKQGKNANHIKNCHVSTITVHAGCQKHTHANF